MLTGGLAPEGRRSRLLVARYERAVHLESDRLFEFIHTGYFEPWKTDAHDQNVTVMRIVATAAAAFADAGYFTIVDGIISPRWFFEPVRDALSGAGHTVAYAVLRAPLATCVARTASRSQCGLVDPIVIEQLWRDFADLGQLETHAIDNDERSAGATAERLHGKLATGELDA